MFMWIDTSIELQFILPKHVEKYKFINTTVVMYIHIYLYIYKYMYVYIYIDIYCYLKIGCKNYLIVSRACILYKPKKVLRSFQ